MNKKNIIKYAIVVFTCLIIFSIVSIFLVNYYNTDMAKNDITRNTKLLKNTLQKQNSLDITQLINGLDELRVTIIDSDGKVIEDTELVSSENHLSREEVQAALKNLPKVVVRRSDTLQTKMMYYAESVSVQGQEYVLRVAIAVTHINGFIISTVLTIIILMLLVVGTLVLITNYTTQKTLQPILKQAEKSRSEFFANASHELKTPLTSIKGFAELSCIVENEEKREQYTQKILKESDRMLVLIDDMLNLSRLEEKATQEHLMPVDLAKVAEICVQNLLPQASSKQIVITKDLKKMVHKGTVEDYTQLLTNLIDNAIKYNKEGGKVVVRTEGNVLEVSDTGIGIPQKHQARVFERFYRVDKGRSRSSGGTGLGLSIVKHIAHKYQAEIVLKSTDCGTSIKIVFKNSDKNKQLKG